MQPRKTNCGGTLLVYRMRNTRTSPTSCVWFYLRLPAPVSTRPSVARSASEPPLLRAYADMERLNCGGLFARMMRTVCLRRARGRGELSSQIGYALTQTETTTAKVPLNVCADCRTRERGRSADSMPRGTEGFRAQPIQAWRTGSRKAPGTHAPPLWNTGPSKA